MSEKNYTRQESGPKKHQKNKAPFLISSVVGVILLGAFYFLYSLNYHDRFMPNSEAFGVDITDKSVDQAAMELHKKLDQMTFHVVEDGKVLYNIKSKDIDLKKNYVPFLKQKIEKQNPALWGVKTLSLAQASDDNDYRINENIKVSINSDNLNRIEQEIENKVKSKRIEPKNAEIVLTEDGYQLNKEVEGNTIDFEKLQNKIRKSIYNANDQIVLSESDYKRPTIRENNPIIQKNFKRIKKYEGTEIVYQIANAATINIPKDKIISWINYDGKNLSLDENKIYNFISNANDNYTTMGITRKFKTADGNLINLKGGTYGRAIKINDDVAKFKAALEKGESTQIQASTFGQGQNEPDANNIGNTYVEVSKAKQHEWVFVDGKLFVESDIVTGKPKNNNDTPTGTFAIWNKQTDQTLKGLNDDGTKYASPVKYWMPIDYTGVGLHDSPWQQKYGGDWFVNNGSHGCINNPPEIIAKFYQVLPIGTPVIIY